MLPRASENTAVTKPNSPNKSREKRRQSTKIIEQEQKKKKKLTQTNFTCKHLHQTVTNKL